MSEVQLNIDFARKARDRGIQKAKDSADNQTPSWSDRAYVILQEFIQIRQGTFQAEEIRKFAYEQAGLPRPPHERAWGSIMRKACMADLISPAGYAQVKNVKAHAATSSLWVRR